MPLTLSAMFSDQFHYYHHVRSVVENSSLADRIDRPPRSRVRGRRQVHLRHYAYYGVCLILAVRHAMAGYCYATGDMAYLSYDAYFTLANKDHVYEGEFFIAASGLPLFGLALHVVLYFRPDAKCWLFMYDLVVRNRDHFLRMNPDFGWSLSLTETLMAPVASGKRFSGLLRSLWTGQGLKEFDSNDRLVSFPHFGSKVRYRLVLIVWTFEALLAFVTANFAFLMPMIFISMFGQADNLHSAILLVLFDCPLQMAYNLVFFRAMLLFTCFGSLMTYLSVIEFGQLNQLLAKYDQDDNSNNANSYLLARSLSQFRMRHASLTRFIVHYNHALLSPTLSSFLLTNFVFNVYLLMFLLLRQTSVVHRIFFILFIAFQMVVPVAMILPIVHINRLIVSSSHRLARIVVFRFSFGPTTTTTSQSGGLVVHKLKSAVYWEVLGMRNRNLISITVGPWGRVTRKSLVNFVALYSCYVMAFWANLMNGTQLMESF